MLLIRFDYACVLWALNTITALQPRAPWSRTYPETAATICQVAHDNPIYQDDMYRSASLLIAMSYHESRFLKRPGTGPSLCMVQLSPMWISPNASLYECLSTGSTLLRQSIEKYGDIRSYTHGTPYPRHDDAGALRLHLAQKIWQQHNDEQLVD